MQLKAKLLGIATGGPLVAVVNQEDAKCLDLHPNDRIKIILRGKIETVVIDIAQNSSAVMRGTIGIFDDILKSISIREGQTVDIMVANKPLSLEYIKKKLDGQALTKKEIDQIVWDIAHNKLSDIELTYLVAATYSHPNTIEETILFTEAMVAEGQRLSFDQPIIMDKHCIGGIPGNRTTLIVVPIVAAAGYIIPKTSSRAITSPAGTADTMEVLAPVVFTLKSMKQIIKKTNACIIWGGALNLAPADDKIINVEKALMIDAESQLLSSIMAKKRSVSSTHIVIDIPIGTHSKVTNRKRALLLEEKFERIGKKLGMHISVLLTDGSQPIGSGIGPALEARDALMVLRQDRERPLDLERKSLHLAGKLLSMAGCKNSMDLAKKILKSGKAYEKMKQIIKAQGGNPAIEPDQIPVCPFRKTVCSKQRGKVASINNISIAKLARIAGAPQAQGAGVYLHVHVGASVAAGGPLYTVYASSKERLSFVEQSIGELQKVVEIGGE